MRINGMGMMDDFGRMGGWMSFGEPATIAAAGRASRGTGIGGSRWMGIIPRIAAPIVITGMAAACAASDPPPERGPAPVAQVPPAQAPQTTTPSASVPPVVLSPAPPAVLRALGSEPVGERSLAALGLTGREKPNGLEYRMRQSVPAALPSYVPRSLDGMELYIADPAEGGWVAFYRDPLSAGRLGPNARFRAVLFGADGARRWDVDLNPLLSRADQLEVQDVRYADGRLFFNEACQSYSRDAGGRCSSLVSVDPVRRAVEWRTPPLTSNNVLLVRGPYIVAGYGFTAESDRLVLVDRATGRVLDQKPLDSGHTYLEFAGDTLVVITVNRVHRFRIEPR